MNSSEDKNTKEEKNQKKKTKRNKSRKGKGKRKRVDNDKKSIDKTNNEDNSNDMDIYETNNDIKLQKLRKEFFKKHINEMPPLYLYSLNDIKDNILLNELKDKQFNIPDTPSIPDDQDIEYLDKIKLIYKYEKSNTDNIIIIKKIDGKESKIKDSFLYNSFDKNIDIYNIIYEDLLREKARLAFYDKNPNQFPPLNLFTLRDLFNDRIQIESTLYDFKIPDIIPKDELQFDKFPDLKLQKHKIAYIWSYKHFYNNCYELTLFNIIKNNYVLDTNNTISNYLDTYNTDQKTEYSYLYTIAKGLIENPSSKFDKKHTFIDEYNDTDEYERYIIDNIKENILTKNNYYNKVKINDKFFPDLKYYSIKDILYGIFLDDKVKYKFKWPAIPPILYKKFPDLKDYNNNNNWILSNILFKFTKSEKDDNIYIITYIDNSTKQIKDENNIISKYLNNLTSLDNIKKTYYLKYKNNKNKKSKIISDSSDDDSNKDNNMDIEKKDEHNNNIQSQSHNNEINISNSQNTLINNIESSQAINSNIMSKSVNTLDSKGGANQPVNPILMSSKYQIFSKYAYTEFNTGSKPLQPILTKWYNKNQKTMHRISWNRYRIDNNYYITYLCAFYPNGGKTYQKNLPEGFTKHNEQGKDNLINIELGNHHSDYLEFEQEVVIKDEYRQAYIKEMESLKKTTSQRQRQGH